MTLRFHVDGWPFLAEFDGSVDIERQWESETVAVRRGPDNTYLRVQLDQVELDKSRAFMAEIRARSENYMHFWNAITCPDRGQP